MSNEIIFTEEELSALQTIKDEAAYEVAEMKRDPFKAGGRFYLEALASILADPAIGNEIILNARELRAAEAELSDEQSVTATN